MTHKKSKSGVPNIIQSSIYQPLVSETKLRVKENTQLQLQSKELIEIMKEIPQASLYKSDFASWGKSNGKLVFGRPEEKYYPMNFVGKVETS